MGHCSSPSALVMVGMAGAPLREGGGRDIVVVLDDGARSQKMVSLEHLLELHEIVTSAHGLKLFARSMPRMGKRESTKAGRIVVVEIGSKLRWQRKGVRESEVICKWRRQGWVGFEMQHSGRNDPKALTETKTGVQAVGSSAESLPLHPG